jgi:hypothetical protein
MKMLCHDPRISNDRNRKVDTDNVALIQAEMARSGANVGLPANAEIDWDVVAEAADHYDWPVDAQSGKPINGGTI